MSRNLKTSESVYAFIIKKIQAGEWLPETQIWTEAKLAEELQVSRVAVRDAVQTLSARSILRKVQGSGTYVEGVNMSTLTETLAPIASISENDLLAIMEFRVSFDPGNTKLFMLHRTPEDLRQLEENYQKMVAARDSPEEFYMADYEFHNIIAQGTKNPFVTQISEICTNVLIAQHQRICQRLGVSIGLEDHGLILKYIKEGDAQLASIHMQRHVQRIMKNMNLHTGSESFAIPGLASSLL